MQQPLLLSYPEACQYLEQLGMSRLRLGLSRIEGLLKYWQNPQDRVPTIHVAGTNGKGSIVAMLTAILKAAGYTVGSTVSPHLVDLKERIQCNGQPISNETLIQLVSQLQNALERIPNENSPDYFEHPTYFESMIALAFLHFHQTACDIAVIETGLGGRLDATNVIRKPVLSIITSISRDHTEVLGDTLTQIATEKAGIIKPGSPVVLGPNIPDEAEQVFLKQAANIQQAQSTALKHVGLSEAGHAIWLDTQNGSHYHLPLLGRYQGENLATVVASVAQLRLAGYAISAEALRTGLKQTYWPARFQYFSSQQWIIDGSHNEAGFHSLAESLALYFNNQPLKLVLSLRQNRDPQMLVDMLIAVSQNHLIQEICCICGEPETLYHSPKALKQRIEVFFPDIPIIATTRAEQFQQFSGENDTLTLLTGSLYTAGSLLHNLQHIK